MNQPSEPMANVPDEFREFNHYWNIQMCVTKCINSSLPYEYVQAVKQFEATLISDLNDHMMQQLFDLESAFREKYRAHYTDEGAQMELAREKYRLLYGFTKRKSPLKAVLAIGRPIKCGKCGAVMPWNRERKKEQEVAEDEPKPVQGTGTPTT